jgi:predicted AAA+ superfamily ATPase
MKRLYQCIVEEHLNKYTQMVFLAGARQVGKTTIGLTAENLSDHFVYLNWDVKEHRLAIQRGAIALAEQFQLLHAYKNKPIVMFDELHKYKEWKNFLKGFFDLYKEKVRIIVTGSSKLNIFRRGGDSLMGRYFCYRVNPISVAEWAVCTTNSPALVASLIQPPKYIDKHIFDRLFTFGGFPDPFLNHESTFLEQWKSLKFDQLFREDIRTISHIMDLSKVELLAELLKEQVGQLVNYTNLANKVGVAVTTIQSWIKSLQECYYCFLIKPWSTNVTRSLLKEPKVFLTDWSDVQDLGARAENFVASHLLKAVQLWADRGLAHCALYFIRDKEKREVDFVIVKDKLPWFLVEVKYSKNQSISENLYRFQEKIKAKHAFQLVFDKNFIDIDCFSYTEPVIVPAATFLSQLC